MLGFEDLAGIDLARFEFAVIESCAGDDSDSDFERKAEKRRKEPRIDTNEPEEVV